MTDITAQSYPPSEFKAVTSSSKVVGLTDQEFSEIYRVTELANQAITTVNESIAGITGIAADAAGLMGPLNREIADRRALIYKTTPIYIDGIGYCSTVEIDRLGKPTKATGPTGSWELGSEGYLVKVADLGKAAVREFRVVTSQISLPNVGPCHTIEIDKLGKPYRAWNLNNQEFALQDDGFMGPVGEAPEPTPVYISHNKYTGIDLISNGRQPWSYLTDDIIRLFVIFGQSLSGGQSPDNFAQDTARSIEPVYPGKALMLNTGVRLYPEYADATGLIDLVEADVINVDDLESGYQKETVASGLVNTFIAQTVLRTGTTPTVGALVSAHGGTPYRGLQRGSEIYNGVLRGIEQFVNLAKPLGKKVIVTLVQLEGEADNSTGVGARAYANMMVQQRMRLEPDIKARTDQSGSVELILTQPNRQSTTVLVGSQTAMGALMASKMDPAITLAGPVYWGEANISNSTHLSSYGYHAVGCLLGYTGFDQLHDVGFQPIEALEAFYVSPRVIRTLWPRDMLLDISGNIISTEGSFTTPGGGVQTILAGAGGVHIDHSATPALIQSVSVSGKTVDFTLASDPLNPTASRIILGSRNTGGGMGKDTGPRTLLRATNSWGTDRYNRVIHDWAVQQQISLGRNPF